MPVEDVRAQVGNFVVMEDGVEVKVGVLCDFPLTEAGGNPRDSIM